MGIISSTDIALERSLNISTASQGLTLPPVPSANASGMPEQENCESIYQKIGNSMEVVMPSLSLNIIDGKFEIPIGNKITLYGGVTQELGH